MKKLILIVLCAIFPSIAMAQQSPEQQTASALGQQIGLLVLSNAQQVTALQRQIDDLKAQLEAAKAKLEAPKEEEKHEQ